MTHDTVDTVIALVVLAVILLAAVVGHAMVSANLM